MAGENIDHAVVRDFGREWARYDQRDLPDDEARRQFEAYFASFPWAHLRSDAVGMDVGCGSGRWAAFVAPRVGKLHCIDPSEAAVGVARRNLAAFSNCEYHVADASNIPLPDESCDFGYALGVLHHVPDTGAALQACAAKLKPGAPFLVYLYYRFDNRPIWFKALWRLSDGMRRLVARLPFPAKVAVTQVIAAGVYWPLARVAAWFERRGVKIAHWPLAQYRRASFYTMRTDALDRFGTRLEHRFTKGEIRAMMEKAGFSHICFSEEEPYWCAVGIRR